MATTRPSVTIEICEPDDHFEGILAVYRENDWSHANSPERLRRAIEASSFSVVAIEEGEVVGFARAMSDEAFAVYIADILVLPDLQRQGIGRSLLSAILDHYPMETFHHQVLIAERGAEGFYRRLGLLPVGGYGLTAFIRSRGA